MDKEQKIFGVKIAVGVMAVLCILVFAIGFIGTSGSDNATKITCTGYVVNDWLKTSSFTEVNCVSEKTVFCSPLAWKPLAWFEDESSIRLVAGGESKEKSITVEEGASKKFSIGVCGVDLVNPTLTLIDNSRKEIDQIPRE